MEYLGQMTDYDDFERNKEVDFLNVKERVGSASFTQQTVHAYIDHRSGQNRGRLILTISKVCDSHQQIVMIYILSTVSSLMVTSQLSI